MNPFLTHCPLLVRGSLTALLSGLLLGAQAQPTVTSTTPARNANAAPRPGNVALTYSQPINSATASTVRVFSQQAGGRKALAAAAASGNTVTLDPAVDFKPGEVVFVTAPATVLGTGGAAAVPYVYQFTAQAGAGPGTFMGGTSIPTGIQPRSVVTADLDGDGDLDFVTANYDFVNNSSSTLIVRLNNGNGTFTNGNNVAVGDGPVGVTAADVNGDGYLDLLAANRVSNTISVRLNNGNATFSGTTEVPVGVRPLAVVAADVDGDGDLDLLVPNLMNSNPSVITSTVSVRLNNGSGVFSGTTEISVGISPVSVVAADIDGDGDLDLLVANATSINNGSNTVSLRFNDGTGTFSGTTNLPVGINLADVAVADVDGDGDLDLLAAVQGSSTVNVRFNDGSGTFSGTTNVPLGSMPFDVTTADVDGDGDLDILTANFNSTVSVRLNNGMGTFSGNTDVPVGTSPANVTVADVDGDGDLDILTANQNDNTVSIRLNQLAAAPPTITSFTPTSGAVGISVMIMGTNFTGATGVTFNGTTAPGFVVNLPTQITVSVPAGATTGPIAVTTPGGTATSPTSFVVNPAPTVTITTTSANPTSIAPFLVTVTFSQPVTGFTASSITVTNGGVSSPLTVVGNAYSFNVTPVAAGAVTISVAAGVAQNAGGTGNTAATPLVITYQIINTNSVWTGATSTDWFVGSNWTSGVPTAFHDAIVITSSFGRQPLIGGGAALSKDLLIQTGASLTMSGGTLDVRGDWANFSTFTATGGTVLLGAKTTANNLFGSSTSRFWNLNVQPNGLQISTSAGATVQRVLALTGPLTTLGNPFTLESNSTGTALVVNSGGTVVGNATVQRFIDPSINPGLGYRHYSSPVVSTTVADLATPGFTPLVDAAYNTPGQVVNPFPNVFGYDEARIVGTNAATQDINYGYFSPSSLATTLVPGRGYSVYRNASEKVDLVGTLNTGTVAVGALSRGTQASSGWHLLGNPYPAPLDWKIARLSLPAGVQDAVYVFKSTDLNNGTYQFYQNGFGTLPDGLIGSMQGFFLRVDQPVPAFSFQNAWRVTSYQNPTFNRPLADTRPAVQLDLVTAQGQHDAAFVYFEAGATAAFDSHFDAFKLPNSTGLNLASVAGSELLAVNGLPVLGSTPLAVPLTVQVPAPGAYALHAAQLLNLTGTPVYLRDIALGTLTDLSQQPTYSFNVSNFTTTGRFELVFQPQQVTATASAALAQQVALYPNPAKTSASVVLPASLGGQPVAATLFDALGRAVRTLALPAQGTAPHQLSLTNLAAGVYTLHLRTSAGVVVKRLVVE